MTSMLIATGLGAAALTYLAIIESRRAYQRGIEHEAYLTGIEQGIGVRRYYPTSPAPQPPDGLPAFNPHLPRTARLIRAAECSRRVRRRVLRGLVPRGTPRPRSAAGHRAACEGRVMLAALAYGIGLTVSVIGVLLCMVAIARDHWGADQ